MMTDPIADMLTRIRNGNNAKHKSVEIPASKIKAEIARILLEEGYIKGYDVLEEGPQGKINVELKYGRNDEKVISGIKKISKPGLLIYQKQQHRQTEAPIHVSNVMYYDTKTNKKSRIGYKYEDGKKVRVIKSSGATISDK